MPARFERKYERQSGADLGVGRREEEATRMVIVGYGLIGVGGFLVATWFGTRLMMLREGTWAKQGGAGSYIWLVIYVAMILAGHALLE